MITIVLLVLGALGALNFASQLMQLPASTSTFINVLGVDGAVVPSSVTTLGTVGAITILVIYALNVIYSIQRLRARKITFWVPLAAGAIAFILVVAFTFFAWNEVPGLIQAMAEPDAVAKLLAYLGETAQ